MKNSFFNTITGITLLGAGWYILHFSILPAGQACHWDEVAHTIFGANIYYDLIQKDILNVLFDIYRQVYWPPVHSVLVGAAFCFTGLDLIPARSISLLLFLIMAWLLVQTARDLSCNRPYIAGITALILTLSTPSLILFSAMAMLETPGMFFMVLSFFIYFKICRNDKPEKAHLLLGMAVTLTYFTKQHYAVLVAITILFNEIIEHRFCIRPLFNRRNYYAVLPLGISLLIWFAYPPKFISALKSLISFSWGIEDTYSLDGLLFYPRALIEFYGSAFILAVHCFCAAFAVKYFNDKRIRFLLLFVITFSVISELHHNKAARHIIPMIPAMILLTSHIAAQMWHSSSRFKIMAKVRVRKIFIVTVLCFSLFVIASSYRRPYEQSHMEISDRILEIARGKAQVLILGSMDLHLQNPPMIDWQLITELENFDPPQAGIATSSAEARKLQRALDRFSAPEWLIDALGPILARSSHIGKSRSIYLGNYPFNYKTREAFDLFFQETIKKGGYARVIIATSLNQKAKFPFAYFSPSLKKAGFLEKSTSLIPGGRINEYVRQ